jgi:hypothetical protein
MNAETTDSTRPEMRPHPRVLEEQRRNLTLAIGRLQAIAATVREPVTSTRAAIDAAANLVFFTATVRGLYAGQRMRADPHSPDSDMMDHLDLNKAAIQFSHAANMLPDEPMQPMGHVLRDEIVELAAEAARIGHKHPYRIFHAWAREAGCAAFDLANTAAARLGDRGPLREGVTALRLALDRPQRPGPMLSDGYLDRDDLAMICFTRPETIGIWIQRYQRSKGHADAFPYPDFYGFGDTPLLWHADRACQVRAWWLRHDELPVAEKSAVTSNMIADKYLIPAL